MTTASNYPIIHHRLIRCFIELFGLEFGFRTFTQARGTIKGKRKATGVFTINRPLGPSTRSEYPMFGLVIMTPAGEATLWVDEELFNLTREEDAILIKYRVGRLDQRQIEVRKA